MNKISKIFSSNTNISRPIDTMNHHHHHHHHPHNLNHQPVYVTAEQCITGEQDLFVHHRNQYQSSAQNYVTLAPTSSPSSSTGSNSIALSGAAARDDGERQRRKKARTMFTNYQLTMLETTFQQSPYPDAHTRRNLAARLGLEETRVQVWFQNRRAKWRKKATTTTTLSLRTNLHQHLQQHDQIHTKQQDASIDLV